MLIRENISLKLVYGGSTLPKNQCYKKVKDLTVDYFFLKNPFIVFFPNDIKTIGTNKQFSVSLLPHSSSTPKAMKVCQ